MVDDGANGLRSHPPSRPLNDAVGLGVTELALGHVAPPQAHRDTAMGRCFRPLMRLERSHFGSPASSMVANLLSISSKKIFASNRASMAPRQKWVPTPKPRCGFGERLMSKCCGSGNTSSSLFAEV